MCGIAGFYSSKTEESVSARYAQGQAMGDALVHRGPDAGGVWCDPDFPITLAHRRLSILDLSDAGAQPMEGQEGRYVLTYNGEIYNFRDLKKELMDQGRLFRGDSDTEVILHAVEEWGFDAAIKKLNGMFVIVLWDRQDKILYFARDRFGKKPLYVGWCGESLVFASELKAFHTYPDFKKQISECGLAIYMRYGYLHAPHTIYEDVYQLMPASCLTIHCDDMEWGTDLSVQMKNYWDITHVASQGKARLLDGTEGAIIDEFEGLLEQAVKERMVSDVPLGAFLSGGIDSSTVVALMQKYSDAPVKTFSIGFHEKEFDEAVYAKKIAMHLGTEHREFYVSEQDALAVIPQLAEMYDEPFSDQSQIPTYLISKLAREHVTVALTGDGGDEILAGYDRHTKISNLWAQVGWMPHGLRKVLFGMMVIVCPKKLIKIKRALSLMGLKDERAIYETLITSWQEKVTVSGGGKVSYKTPDGLNFSEAMMVQDLRSYRVNDLMVKTDRASMAVALEARAPLMDYKLAEYCWRVPHAMKVRNGKGKWLLRQVLKRHVPEVLFERPKMGFSIPLAKWLRGDLKEWAEKLINTPHPLLKNDIITVRWDTFQQSNSDQVPKDLWTALMFKAWYERWK